VSVGFKKFGPATGSQSILPILLVLHKHSMGNVKSRWCLQRW